MKPIASLLILMIYTCGLQADDVLRASELKAKEKAWHARLAKQRMIAAKKTYDQALKDANEAVQLAATIAATYHAARAEAKKKVAEIAVLEAKQADEERRQAEKLAEIAKSRFKSKSHVSEATKPIITSKPKSLLKPTAPPRNQRHTIADGTAFAKILVKVPPDSDVFFDTWKSSKTGSDRYLISPMLKPGLIYSYSVRVITNGVETIKSIFIRAGETTYVDFTGRLP